MKKILLLISFMIGAGSQHAISFDKDECPLTTFGIEDLAKQSCSAAQSLRDNHEDEIIKDKKAFKDKLPRKIKKSFERLTVDSKLSIAELEKSIKEEEQQIKEYEENIKTYRSKMLSIQANNKLNEDEKEDKIKKEEEKIAKKEEKIAKSKSKIQSAQDAISGEKNVIQNLDARATEVANRIKANDCKGLLHRVQIDPESNVEREIPKEQTKGISTKEKNEMKRTLGEFDELVKASEFKSKILSENPHFTNCAVTPKDVTVNVDKPIQQFYSKTLDKVSGAGESFVDNGKGLSTTSTEKLNEASDAWKNLLETKTDDLGRTVERQLTKIKIYTCASTYRNCSPHAASNRTADQDSCQMIDLLRKFTVSEIKGALQYDLKTKEKIGSSKDAFNSKLFKQLSSEDKVFLNSVLGSKSFKNALDEVYTGADEETNPELKLWIALSAMRAETMKAKIKADMKDKSGLVLSDEMFEIIPTGHPNDQFRNSQIDPALTGTCGPLPKSQDTYFGDCNKDAKDNDSCSPEKPWCNKLKKHYQQEDVIQARKELMETYVGKDYASKSSEEQYKIHRYYQIEPEFIEKVTETTTEEVIKKRYIVTCKKISFSCDKIDITPDIKLDINLSFHPRAKVYTPKGKWGSTDCPSF